MSRDNHVDMAASIKARLINYARAHKTDVQRVLTRYANERFLYRLSQSDYEKHFILKGATLFTVWMGAPHRNTGDLDFLGSGDNTPEAIRSIFLKILETPVSADGIVLQRETLTVEVRRDEEKYPGVKCKVTASLGSALTPLQIDIGFGDAATPESVENAIPVLLGEFAIPRLKMYPRETVVVEKLEIMIDRGIANSRLRASKTITIIGIYRRISPLISERLPGP